MKYLLTLRYDIEAEDDIDARNLARGIVEQRPNTGGLITKLQALKDHEPPRIVKIWGQDAKG